ncbi:hypothetical protein ACQJBY_059721 [Aegilops geniculata]
MAARIHPNPPPAPGSGDAPLADDPAGPTRLSRPPPQPRRAFRGRRPIPGAPPGTGPHPQRTSFHSQIASRRRPRSPPHPHRRTFTCHCIPWLGCTRPGSPISQLSLQLHASSLVLRCRSFDPLHWCARPDAAGESHYSLRSSFLQVRVALISSCSIAGWALCELQTDQWLDQQQFTVPTRLIPPGTRLSLSDGGQHVKNMTYPPSFCCFHGNCSCAPRTHNELSPGSSSAHGVGACCNFLSFLKLISLQFSPRIILVGRFEQSKT